MTTQPPTTGNQASFAAHCGVSRQTVTDWKRRGLLVFTEGGDVDFSATDQRLSDHGVRQPTADSLTEFPTSIDDLTMVDGLWSKGDAETVKENFAARLKQLEYERAEAEVVTVNDAARMISDEYTIVRNRVRGLGAEVASDLVALQSPEEIKAVIDAAVTAALADLSGEAAHD